MRRFLFVLLVTACLPGCIWPGQERVTGPRVERESTVLGPDGQPASRTVVKVEGAGYQGRRMKDAKFDDVWVEHGEARAGGMSFEGFPLPSASEMKPLYLLGGLCIVAGVVVGWLCGWGLGLALAGAGVGLIATATLFDKYPWIALLPVVAGVAVGVWALIDLWRGARAREALGTVAQAIEAAPAEVGAVVKAKVAEFAGAAKTKIKDTITAAKRKVAANG